MRCICVVNDEPELPQSGHVLAYLGRRGVQDVQRLSAQRSTFNPHSAHHAGTYADNNIVYALLCGSCATSHWPGHSWGYTGLTGFSTYQPQVMGESEGIVYRR